MYKKDNVQISEEFCVEFPQGQYNILSDSCRHCD